MLLAGAMVRPAPAQITADQVRESIERGVGYLKRQQNPNGTWNEYMGQPGGLSALCTLALLEAGVNLNDNAMQQALKYMRSLRADKTYAVSLQTMVLCRAEPKRDMLIISRNVRWLEEQQIPAGPTQGAWSYPGLRGDNSNAQFALLALYEAERVGVRVRPQTWRLAKAYWEDCQNADGSWGYTKGLPGTGSMTCAGITSLVIANDMVQRADAQVEGDRIKCCQRAEGDNSRVERGLDWLGRHFAVTHNPGTDQRWLLYYLYAMERVGRMTNHRFIGEHDWYREGADFLIKMKGGPLTDHWVGKDRSEANEQVATSFALLFLAKGRWPILVSKLNHGGDDGWNQHRSDIANLTRYVEQKWQRNMVWQVVNLDAATVDDLTQSPVLYYCGINSPLPDSAKAQDELAQKLRGYLDRGGFLLAEGYCGGAGFDDGFRKLMLKVFPEPEYRLRVLPPEHPIWRAEEPVPPEQIRPLLGIEFGCRTSVVYVPPDNSDRIRAPLSCLWELSRTGREQKYSKVVQDQIDAGLSLGINIFAYATNRELPDKDPLLPTPSGKKPGDSIERGKLYVASLRHPGGCTAAPRALANLLKYAADELKMRVNTESRELAITDASLFDYPIVFMHGRNAFSLTPDERKQLKTYLERGGVLFANSICASKQFSDSFRKEMQAILPDKPLKPIPVADAILTAEYGGFDLSKVKRRDPQSRAKDQPLKALVREVPVELEGLKIGDRYGVIFSPYDLSCALEKQDTMECQGYTREDAARIGLNVVLYALQQ